MADERDRVPKEGDRVRTPNLKDEIAKRYFFFAGLPGSSWQPFDAGHEESLDVPWIPADPPDNAASIQAPSRPIDEVARFPGPTIPDFRSHRGACLEGQFDPVP